jgi:hypothetical protein
VFGEPVQALPDHRRGGLTDRFQMGPRADGQRDVKPTPVQVGVLLEGLLEEQVLPAGLQQHRYLDPIKGRTQLHTRPERVR